MFEQALVHLSSFELWFSASVLVALLRVIWSVVGHVTSWVLFELSLRTEVAEFEIPAMPDRPVEILACKCLFVRYGNDCFLKELASDQEKHHGRLRNRILPVGITERPDRARAGFSFWWMIFLKQPQWKGSRTT